MLNQVDAYLDALNQGLKSLPIHERLEQLDEIRAPLEGLAELAQKRGHSRLDAEAQAIVQFGEVRVIAQQLNRAATRRRWGHTVGVAAIYMGIASCFAMPLQSLFTLGSTLYRDALGKSPSEGTTVLVFAAVLGNILTGLVAGALLRRLAPGNTLRPLLLVSAAHVMFSVFSVLRQTGPASMAVPIFANGIWGIVLSFFNSGALEEVPDALLRLRRRVV
ncbi:hypothetical protein [Armatimonas sp.]|uniref:hypothetical protein n=1 Tax=Armatimonas sp. TaxID=1872638 RepID=UPI00286A667C|nr:hypothetical protein [Armatimonas sp.]